MFHTQVHLSSKVSPPWYTRLLAFVMRPWSLARPTWTKNNTQGRIQEEFSREFQIFIKQAPNLWFFMKNPVIWKQFFPPSRVVILNPWSFHPLGSVSSTRRRTFTRGQWHGSKRGGMSAKLLPIMQLSHPCMSATSCCDNCEDRGGETESRVEGCIMENSDWSLIYGKGDFGRSPSAVPGKAVFLLVLGLRVLYTWWVYSVMCEGNIRVLHHLFSWQRCFIYGRGRGSMHVDVRIVMALQRIPVI